MYTNFEDFLFESYRKVDKELSKFDKYYDRADDFRAFDKGRNHLEQIRKMASDLSDKEIQKLEKKYGVILKGKDLPKEKPYNPKMFGPYQVSKDAWGFRVDRVDGLHNFEVQTQMDSEKEAIKVAKASEKENKRREKLRKERGL